MRNGWHGISYIFHSQPPPFVVAPSSVASTCGIANGTASVSTTGGVTPYSYVWNTGDTLSSINHLVGGNYNVTVTDSMVVQRTHHLQLLTTFTADYKRFGEPDSFYNNNNGSASVIVSG